MRAHTLTQTLSDGLYVGYILLLSLPAQGGEMGEKPSAPRPALYYNFPRFVFVRDFILEFVYSS